MVRHSCPLPQGELVLQVSPACGVVGGVVQLKLLMLHFVRPPGHPEHSESLRQKGAQDGLFAVH